MTRDDETGVQTQTLIFLGSGVFMTVAAVVYWVASYEEAGSTMLALAAGFSFFCAGWLRLQRRRADRELEHEPAAPEPEWFPHASLWPFWIGLAGFFLTNGLIVGSWFLVPGLILLLVGVVGYAAQSRSRSA